MIPEPAVAPAPPEIAEGPLPDSRNPVHRAENLAVTAALAAMVVIPAIEVLFRIASRPGITASSALVQHLTLVVSMIGAAIAAREGRLLALATSSFLPPRVRPVAQIYSAAVAAAVAMLLATASYLFLLSEKEGGKDLAWGIPLWVVQAILPAGFAVIAMRLLWRSSASWTGRFTALAVSGAILLIGIFAPVSSHVLVYPAFAALFLATLCGAPIFAVLGGSALILFWAAEIPIAATSVDHYSLVVNPSLPAIPLFTLAGYLLAEGGASTRLVRVFDALMGQFRGGPAIVTALACAFFTSFTGGSGVTILALGGLLMPVLIGARYSEKTALGLITGAGSLGLLFPPCLPLILYAIVAQVTIEQMFLAGIVPGLLMLALTIWWGVAKGPAATAERRKFDAADAWNAVWAAKWELLLPLFVLAALFSGFATPVEAAALTALYAFVVEVLVYRDYRSIGQVSRVVAESGLLVGGVLLILGVALGFTNYLVDAEVPARAAEWATSSVTSPLLFLLLLNLFLLVVGCLMDIYSAIVVVVPIVVPIGLAFGLDPIHLGIIFLANLELGYLTPPVGMNLFLASYRFGKPMSVVARAALPMLGVLLVGVLAITYFPPLTTFLPRIAGR